MNKKAVMAATITLIFLISLVTGMRPEVAKSNPSIWFHSEITITIQSPQNGTYTGLPVLLNFTAHCNFNITLSDTNSFFYVLDEQNITVSKTRFTEVQSIGYDFSGQTTLTGLTDGEHNITVYYVGLLRFTSPPDTIYYINGSKSATSQFAVDSTPPAITIISPPQNTTYPRYIPLIFDVNETTSWLRYSLDNQDNMSIAGNVTLADLPDGAHNLVIYANDTTGNIGKSDTVFFSIITQPSPTPSLSHTQPSLITPVSVTADPAADYTPILMLLAIILVTIAIGVVAYVYFRKK